MFELLPGYYKKSRVMREIINTLEQESVKLCSEVETTGNQFFVGSADRDISLHEKDVGFLPDDSVDLGIRRDRIMSRLRGAVAVTKPTMTAAVRAFTSGEVEIIEHFNIYTFQVKIEAGTLTPEALVLVETIKPAHLAVLYRIITPTAPNVRAYYLSAYPTHRHSKGCIDTQIDTHFTAEAESYAGTLVRGRSKIELEVG